MFKLPELGFGFDALEPYIDAQTMEIHHGKHHAAYVEKLNAALEKYPHLQVKKIEDILSDIKKVPQSVRTAVQNNGGGHHNHTLFWESMNPRAIKDHHANLADALKSTFGSLDEFKAMMTEAAINRFGSGWAWLVKDGDKLEVYSTANQDSPLMEGKTPILGLDVWEHATILNTKIAAPTT